MIFPFFALYIVVDPPYAVNWFGIALYDFLMWQICLYAEMNVRYIGMYIGMPLHYYAPKLHNVLNNTFLVLCSIYLQVAWIL